jgi:glycerate 2-kinase
MHVLIAPDKFKGTLSALEVADAINSAVRELTLGSAREMPLGDGGDGTLEALTSTLGGRVLEVQATGPIGEPVGAPIGRLDDGRFVVEAASVAGLAMLPAGRERPLEASSVGVGELIAFAARAEAEHVLVGVGGTASTDGGSGAATAAGWKFLDMANRPLAPGGGALVGLRRIEPPHGKVFPRVTAACDVTNPLTGPNGAAAVFGPQKGASEHDVERLEEGLVTLAERIRLDLGLDVANLARAGAGGGLGAGLRAFFDADLVDGFELVARSAGLHEALREVDLVVTGEGRLDRQSFGGKVAAGVAAAARAAGVTCVAVAGEVALSPDELESLGIRRAISLVEAVGEKRAYSDPQGSVRVAATELLRAFEL